MKFASDTAVVIVAAVSAAVLYLVFANGAGGSSTVTAIIPTHTPAPAEPTPTPLPVTWTDGLETSRGGEPIEISCLDRNGDGRLNAADGGLDGGGDLAGLDIPLVAGQACKDAEHQRDFYAGPPSDPSNYNCDAPKPPVLIVSAASAGSNLLDPTSGESMGLLDIVRALQQRLSDEGTASDTILATSAVFGADLPQTRMEQWLEHEISQRLDAMPCLRAVIMGHSHGGVTVTSVTAALDDRYSARMFGVTIDRSTALYDRNATEMPAKTEIFNVFQLNEGWHGEKIDLPNFANLDASTARAPVAPSDGGGGLALVSHKTLDDAPMVQTAIEDAVMSWVSGVR
jgi:hypothetical protein